MSDPLVNIEAEAELLGSLMTNAKAIDPVADLLSADDFAEPLHGRMFATILREHAAGKPATPVTLRGFFENDPAIEQLGGVVYLARLTGNCVGIATYEIAQQLVDLATRRRMRAGLSTAADACGDLEASIPEIVSFADSAMNVTGRDSISQLSIADCIAQHLATVQQKDHGIRCQTIKPLDDLLGPMKPKQLVIGAGRPGMGKTALAVSYGLGAAEAGHGVLFVSLEMAGDELGARVLADLCFDGEQGVPYSFIRDGDLRGRQMDMVLRAQGAASALPFTVIDTGSLTIGRLGALVRREARRMKANGYKLELVIVDYLQLLQPDTKGRSTYEAVSEISRGLKALAKDQGVAVFALAQLSRSVENRPDKRPMLSDLRDSGQIEQDADAVLFLLRQEYYLAQKAEEERDHAWHQAMEQAQGKIEFILAKRRNGITGNAEGHFHGKFQAVRG